jgi:hypothetical protein
MSCATELLHPANFCPVCGARLAAPTPDGSAATVPGGTTPSVVAVPPDQPEANVVYLTEERGIQSGPPGSGAVPANPHAYEYEGAEAPTRAEQPPSAGPHPPPTPLRPRGTDEPSSSELAELRARAAEVHAQLEPFGSHGPVPQPHELVPPPTVDDNPFGDFFSDGPSAWLEDDDPQDGVRIEHPRVVGTMLAAGAVLMLLAGWVVWGVGMYKGAGGAESGGFILLAMLLWIWYLSMPREQQHAFMLRRHAGIQRLVDRRTSPLRERTEGQLLMRRERDRYRAMRDERTRRVTALGEGAYRSFRQGTLPTDLHPGAQRVMAIERQMLTQDQRIHSLDAERRDARGRGDGQRGADPATGTPEGGHPGT